jgi:organic radical activating enzyme
MKNVSDRVVTSFTVEYNLTDHCNLSCYDCDHASPLLPPRFAALGDFVRDLEALAVAFHSKEVRLIGGEPLLHPDLLQFLKEARRIGIADSVVVYTNGVLLHEVPDEFWTLIDRLHISAYPGVRRRLDEKACARVCAAHGVEFSIDHIDHFHKALVARRNDDPRLVEAVYRSCEAANGCLTVHEGRFYKCSAAPIVKPWLALHNVAFDNREADGVMLHDNENLPDDLRRYLASPAPLAACMHCLGTSGSPSPHRQLNRRGCGKWLEEDGTRDIAEARARLLGVAG